MALKTYNPVTSAQRQLVLIDRTGLHQGKPVKQRTVVVMPNDRRSELEPNKTMYVQVMLEGMSENDDRAKIKMEVTGLKEK